VIQRATQTLEWAEGQTLVAPLEIGLDHLTLTRASLVRELLMEQAPDPAAWQDARPTNDHIAAAVDGLRESGMMDDLPRGLLTRSWVLFRSGDKAGSQADLAEAEEIAERGPMPLFLADVYL